MMPSLPSFVDELEKIAEESNLPLVSKPRLGSSLKSTAMLAMGAGLGGALGSAFTNSVLVPYASSLGPSGRRWLSLAGTGLAAAGGLAMAAALARQRALAQRAEEDYMRQRDLEEQSKEFQAGGPP